MIERFIITAITYLIAGMIPALLIHYVFRPGFIGGIWGALLVGLIAAFVGGLIDTFLLIGVPDLILIGRIVDAGPPLILSTIVTVLFALVSRSNSS